MQSQRPYQWGCACSTPYKWGCGSSNDRQGPGFQTPISVRSWTTNIEVASLLCSEKGLSRPFLIIPRNKTGNGALEYLQKFPQRLSHGLRLWPFVPWSPRIRVRLSPCHALPKNQRHPALRNGSKHSKRQPTSRRSSHTDCRHGVRLEISYLRQVARKKNSLLLLSNHHKTVKTVKQE